MAGSHENLLIIKDTSTQTKKLLCLNRVNELSNIAINLYFHANCSLRGKNGKNPACSIIENNYRWTLQRFA